jgi:hypothetical protein
MLTLQRNSDVKSCGTAKCCKRLIVLLYKKLLAYFNILSINVYSNKDASRLQAAEMNS